MPKKSEPADEFVLAKSGCGRGSKGGTRVEVRAAATPVIPLAKALPALLSRGQGGVVLLTTGTEEANGGEEEEVLEEELLKVGRRAVVVETKEGRGWPPV